MQQSQAQPNHDRGSSLLELIVTMALIALLSAVAISNIKILENPLANASFNISHYMRLIRSRAISQTTTITVIPSSSAVISAYSADSCESEDLTEIPDLQLELEDDVHLSSTDWSVCFNQRGLASEHITFDFYTSTATKTVQIALGGGVKIE